MKGIPIDKIKPYYNPLFLFLLSFILRLALICKGPFHIDCLNLAIKAQETLATGHIHPLPGFGYPLTVLLGALFIKTTNILGNTDPIFAVNLMSVVLGSLGVSFLYLFISNLLNQRTALFSAVIFSFYPFYFGESLYGMSHAPSILFLLTGLYFLSIYKNTSRLLHLMLASLCLGLMSATRVQDLALMLIPISFYYFLDDFEQLRSQNIFGIIQIRIKKFLLLISGIVILGLSFHLPLMLDKAYQQESALSWYWKAQLISNFMGFFSPHFQKSLLMIIFSFSPPGIFLSLSGLGLLGKRNLFASIFLLMWLIMTFMFLANLRTTTSRFLILCAIPLIVAEGYSLDYLTKSRFRFFKIAAIVLFGFVLWVTFTEAYPIFKFRHENAPLVDFSRWVASVTEPNAVIIAADDRLAINYYGHRESVHNPCGIYYVHKAALPVFKKWLDHKLAQGQPVYITYSGLRAGDRTHEFRDFIFKNYTLSWVGQHLSEDWHGSSTQFVIGQEYLYKISLRSTPLAP